MNLISFIHLSDIHFNKNSGGPYDIDADLRNEILLDISENYLPIKRNNRGVLVCGDIAFSGKEEEYNTAEDFLNKICDNIEVDRSSVFCVPGNHDIDQNIPKDLPHVKSIQSDLANQKDILSYSDKLGEILGSEEAAELLYRPLEKYNTVFAEQYNCSLHPNKLQWEEKMVLSDKYDLCIIGMNSTIISNSDDHATKFERLMKMSEIQVPKREPGTIFLTLCHHPPECWDDPEREIINKMCNRVAVQLYGHKHEQAVEMKDNSLIIKSGATQPSRREDGWIPRYNWIELDVVVEGNKDILIVRIYPRVYDKDQNKFVCDHKLTITSQCIEYKITIGGTLGTKCKPIVENQVDANKENGICETSQDHYEDNSWIRKTVYEFSQLPYIIQCEILKIAGYEKQEYVGRRPTQVVAEIMIDKDNYLLAKMIKLEVDKRKGF